MNLSGLKGFQFFPGQIVALKGSNTSGHEFAVKEVLSFLAPQRGLALPRWRRIARSFAGAGCNGLGRRAYAAERRVRLRACTPPTIISTLSLLYALCERAADAYIDALILTGPFIDADHPLIASGDFDLPDEALAEPDTATMNTVFKYLVSSALNHLAQSNPQITILLVPSVRRCD